MSSPHHPLHARSAGVLLHPTSLPGPFGIGDLGPAAYAWIDTLAAAGQSWWQVLPLGPTGYGDSPYQCFSAFAGNPNLISPELLAEDGLLPREDLPAFELPPGPVNFARVAEKKRLLCETAAASFRAAPNPNLKDEWDRFQAENASWLTDYSLFMSFKWLHNGASWQTWTDDYRLRDLRVPDWTPSGFPGEGGIHAFAQFLFFRQWDRLRSYAHSKGVRIIGDMPIFLAEDSADVWAHPELFLLDADRRPAAIAGVPPDYFSATGQLWGNPLYDWGAHEQTGFAWWAERVRAALRQVDLIRLDHFRGFEAYWEVPAGSPTAQTGRWVKGPGERLLRTLRDRLGGLPIIAEDLGVITPAVDALRTGFDLPGMRILQFAFGGAVEDRFLPHNYEPFTVVYTGTHDNDTTLGWFGELTTAERRYAVGYLGYDPDDIPWGMIREAWKSVAVLAVVPAQDMLGLGSEARMNRPGQPAGNWRWRLVGPLDGGTIDRLADLTSLYQRLPRTGAGPTTAAGETAQ
jgi:4-alpha-glucanotransferase